MTMTPPAYPLKQIIEIKRRRVEQAELAVKEKKLALEEEEKRLLECEKARDVVKKHRDDKLQQLREEFAQTTTTDKLQQMRVYLKVVDERLANEEKKVKAQQEQVKIAEVNLEDARKNLAQKRLEVDKLLTHKKDWELESRKEREIIEGREQDELGSVTWATHKRGL